MDRFIALTEFAKGKFVEAGFPAEKIVVKSNFVEDHRTEVTHARDRQGALFVGRLSQEKGIYTLLKAWSLLDLPLRVVGDGPLLEVVRGEPARKIVSLGRKSPEQVATEMGRAAFLVVPSESYETFGIVIIEVFCQGLPVITSRLGAMEEIVENGVTGLHFTPGDPGDLAAKVRWATEHTEEMLRMGEQARRVYKEKYTPETNYPQLMAIYQAAIEENKKTD